MVCGPCVPSISSASEPPSPRGPWLFQGSLRLASSLTPSSAASLGPSARLPSSVIRTVLPYGTLLAWDRDLPSFTVVLSHHAILLRPRDADRCTYPVLPCRYQPSPVTKKLGHPKPNDSF